MITLAIPNKNCGHYIRDTLSSLCGESNRAHLQWWLQDSCSEDDSVAIAEEYRSSADEIVVEFDSSQANGINRAFAKMGGEIVGYINSDDCLAEGAAERVLRAFDENPDTDIVFGAVEWIDSQGKKIGDHRGAVTCLEDALNIYEFWWEGKQWVQPEVFFRRALFDQVGGFDETYSLAFDFDFWVRVLRLRPTVVAIPDTLIHFRRHDQQRSVDFERANDEIRRAVIRQLDDPDCPIASGFRKEIRRKIDYDLYHIGSPDSPKSSLSFLSAVLRSPSWLMLPDVRTRLLRSISSRFRSGTSVSK